MPHNPEALKELALINYLPPRIANLLEDKADCITVFQLVDKYKTLQEIQSQVPGLAGKGITEIRDFLKRVENGEI